MGQSNVIFGALLFAFIVYITARGELSTYIQLLFGGGAQPSSAAGGAGASGSSGNGLENLLGDVGTTTYFNNGGISGPDILGSTGNVQNILNGR